MQGITFPEYILQDTEDGKWYFEFQAMTHGPYDTEHEAREHFYDYLDSVLSK